MVVRSNPGMTAYSTMEKPSVFSKTETGCLRGNRHLMLPTPVLGSTGAISKYKPGRWGGGEVRGQLATWTALARVRGGSPGLPKSGRAEVLRGGGIARGADRVGFWDSQSTPPRRRLDSYRAALTTNPLSRSLSFPLGRPVAAVVQWPPSCSAQAPGLPPQSPGGPGLERPEVFQPRGKQLSEVGNFLALRPSPRE